MYAGSGSARDAGTRHPPEQGGPGEAAHTAAAVAAREREREKRLTLTHTHRGVGRRTVENLKPSLVGSGASCPP